MVPEPLHIIRRDRDNDRPRFGPASVTELIPAPSAYVTAGVKIEIVDAQGKRFGRSIPMARVRIRSKHTATEYVGDPETSRIHFRDGCFYPGDIGRLRGGRYFHHFRAREDCAQRRR
jgi:acyl-CoA synthetase (AMP-forming)/AMP-acid ligase II